MENFQNAEGGLELPPVLDLVAASTLLEAFLENRGKALAWMVPAYSGWGRNASRFCWRRALPGPPTARVLAVENFSEDFLAALELLGVAPDNLTYAKEMAA